MVKQQNSATSLLYYNMVTINFLRESDLPAPVSKANSSCIGNDRVDPYRIYNWL